MTGIFLAPATDRQEAYDHFCKTVLDGVPAELSFEYTDETIGSSTRVWGLTSSIESTWEGVDVGDWLLFYTRKNEYQYAVPVIDKEHNPEFGDAIQNEILRDVNGDRDWDFLLYLDEPLSVSVSGDVVAELLDYRNNYPVRFMRVTSERLESLKGEYGNIDGFIDAIQEQ